jgi:hypothetical protein
MKGYDIYDCFTMEHFQLRQMTLTIKIYCSWLYSIFLQLTVVLRIGFDFSNYKNNYI